MLVNNWSLRGVCVPVTKLKENSRSCGSLRKSVGDGLLEEMHDVFC